MSEEESRDPDAAPAEGAEAAAGTPPTPFQILCGSLAAQVQMALGLLEGPEGGKPTVEYEAARQGIDLLAMLEEKTKGNLDDRESKTLRDLLAYLRMLYVHVRAAKDRAKAPEKEKPDAEDGPGTTAPSGPKET